MVNIMQKVSGFSQLVTYYLIEVMSKIVQNSTKRMKLANTLG
jgi:hypothetical protein